ncbi:unnamed protein product [Plutella xylostella]|uniref:(diamondback moth) hypothetical protein n=1 Tax=Plutella xylostella TaxID=51655 RepID=A0A8S4GDQ7_PLUXY|nr:unnamed protein product [Plutella xylostella]
MNLPEQSVEIMLNGLSDNTYKQYDSGIRAWLLYCRNHGYDYSVASVPIIIDFLTEMFHKGASYGTINSYKSSLTLLFNEILDDYRIKRFMKGVFRMRPSKPKYDFSWNPNIVLTYLSQQGPNEDLTLEVLSKKTVTLLALVTAHRVQTLSLIKLPNINAQNPDEIIIYIPDIIKTSKPNSYQPVLKLPYYRENISICPASCLKEYLNKTSQLRSLENQLFISFKKPHNKITTQTLSHWIKDILCKSGIDTSLFSAHSTRHAATTTASKLGVSIDVIRKCAGWTSASSTFAKFYNKEVVDSDFARSLLSNHSV